MSVSRSSAESGSTLGRFLQKQKPQESELTTQRERLKALTPAILDTTTEVLSFGPIKADIPETTFDIVPTDVIDTIASYHMPGTYNHWTRGEDYWKARNERAHGSRIYELVINTIPRKAYLAENNPDTDQIVVEAHVMGHTDFFAHNIAFRHTDPYMAQNVMAHAERVEAYERDLGVEVVEEFIDAANALMWNIDPDPTSPINSMSPEEYTAWSKQQHLEKWQKEHTVRRTGYEDLWDDLEKRGQEKAEEPGIPFPSFEEQDILRFVRMFAPQGLEEWQVDILDIVRKMSTHLWGQISTKIMNEGWASYAHVHTMRKLDEEGLIPEESDDFLEWPRMHAGVVHPHPHYPNPYQMGLAIWEDIARKYRGEARDDGKPDYDWMGNIIDVTKMSPQEREKYNPRYIMETYRDESFLRDFLTPALVEDLQLYQYALRKGNESWDNEEHYRITTREALQIRDGLVESKIHNGFPMIVVAPGGGDYNGNKELYLLHKHEGKEGSDLNLEDAQGTLIYLRKLWGRAVHLETIVNGERVLLTCKDGQKVKRKSIK